MWNIIRKIIYGMSVFFLLALLSSCVSYEEVNITDIKKLEVQEFSGKKITFSAEVEISNPNNYNITVTNSEFNITTDEKLLGNFSIDNQLKLPKSSEKYHKLNFTVNVNEISPSVQSKLLQIVLSGQEEIDIKVEGFIKARAFMLHRKYPISFEDEVNLSF